MDRRWMGRNQHRKWSNHSNVTEPEYDVVEDQEEALDVCILPARPMHDETEYADRGVSRPPPALGLSSLAANNSDIPRRKCPLPPGPAINRDLKPGKGKTRLDPRSAPLPPEEQHVRRNSPSKPPFTQERVNLRPGLEENPGRGEQRMIKRGFTADFNSYSEGLESTDRFSTSPLRQREAVEPESYDAEKRSQQWMETMQSAWRPHERPPPTEDTDQHEYIPVECPDQTLREEEWYVGACNRSDAEHALHLVNKDGAFLVRDCSVNTDSEPLVLSVYHEKRVFNVKIRYIEATSKYALGTQQHSNNMFDSVADIIKFHSIFPIMLVSGRPAPGSRFPENCLLTCAVAKRDVDQLLLQ